jgi:hypothetical protein
MRSFRVIFARKEVQGNLSGWDDIFTLSLQSKKIGMFRANAVFPSELIVNHILEPGAESLLYRACIKAVDPSTMTAGNHRYVFHVMLVLRRQIFLIFQFFPCITA